jgi:hypothetical protein
MESAKAKILNNNGTKISCQFRPPKSHDFGDAGDLVRVKGLKCNAAHSLTVTMNHSVSSAVCSSATHLHRVVATKRAGIRKGQIFRRADCSDLLQSLSCLVLVLLS